MLFLTLLSLVGGAAAAICPKQKHSDVPQFTTELGGQDMVRMYNSIAIPCCAEGYTNITWYRKEGPDWVKYPPEGSRSSVAPTLEESNQVLRINRADEGDNTSFRCDLLQYGQVMEQHSTEIIVIRCSEMARGPIPTEPVPHNTWISNYGEDVTFYCTGYFGCSTDQQGIAIWSILNESNLPVQSDRYVVTHYSRNYGTMLGAELTVNNVQGEDLHRKFVCELASPQIYEGMYNVSVRIFKKEPPVKINIWRIVGIAVGGVIGLVVLVGVLVCTVNSLYGPRVLWYLHNHLPNCKPPPEKGDMEYNAILYHTNDDTQKAHEVRDKLEGYIIYLSDDIGGNECLSVYEEIVTKSLKIIFLYSENLKGDNFAHFLLQSLISLERHKDIIFLVLDEYIPENVKVSTDSAVNPETDNLNTDAAQSDGATLEGENLNNGSESANIIQNGSLDEANLEGDGEAVVVYQQKDLSFWKSLPRWNVPNENASDRQKSNFICWLQNMIPKFAEQLEEEKRRRKKKMLTNGKRRTSSGRSLLHSQHSQVEEGSALPSSPIDSVTDDVFGRPTSDNRYHTQIVGCVEEEHNNIHTADVHEQDIDVIVNKDSAETMNAVSEIALRPETEDLTASGSSNTSDLTSSLSGSYNQRHDNGQTQQLVQQNTDGAVQNRVKLDPLDIPERSLSDESGYGTSPGRSLSPEVNGWKPNTASPDNRLNEALTLS